MQVMLQRGVSIFILAVFLNESFKGSSEFINASWQSTTAPSKPLSHDRLYYFLPYWDEKPTIYIKSAFPDHRRRMYNSNAITKISEKLVRSKLYIYILTII